MRLLEEDAADVRHRVRRALRHRLVHRVGEDVLQLVLLDVLGDLARRIDLLARHDVVRSDWGVEAFFRNIG